MRARSLRSAATTVWLGQFASAVGGQICWFAITLWAWQTDGRASTLSFLLLSNLLPGILFSPFLGVWVDRLSAKSVMLSCDALLAVVAVVLLLLAHHHDLRTWHLYLVGVTEGVLEAAHWLAYSKVVTTLAGADGLARANAQIGFGESAGSVIAPLAAGLLLKLAGLPAVLLVDLLSYLAGFVTLAFTRVPGDRAEPQADNAETRAGAGAGRDSALRTMRAGLSFIASRPTLRGLVFVFFTLNFVSAVGAVLSKPLLMLRSGQNAVILGSVSSAAGLGAVLGGLSAVVIMRRVRSSVLVPAGVAAACLAGPVLTAVSGQAPWWLVSAFCAAFVLPSVTSAYQTLWQTAVPLERQAQVFGIRRSLVQAATPLGLLIAGPAVDLAHADPVRTSAVVLGAAGVLGSIVGVAALVAPTLRAARSEAAAPTG
ncbi:DHA3 family macrolide efflux protein-like MFS transporter [Catenulispora sp. EB89]